MQRMQPLEQPTPSFLRSLEDFITTFNKMEGKSSIDTIEREEIGEVLKELMRSLPTAVQQAAFDAFETLREF